LNYLEIVENDSLLNYYYTLREKENYINQWKKKLTEPFNDTFTKYGFDLYMTISLENSKYDTIQSEHYFDEGCTCKLCKSQRRRVFYKLYERKGILSPEDKIIHKECLETKMRKTLEILKKQYVSNTSNIIEMKVSGNNNNNSSANREKFTKMILF